MDQNCALLTAGIVFAIVSILQLTRVIFNFEFRVANYLIPRWASLIAFLVIGALSIWMFMART